jgi:DNA-binding response OmpR family regulator
MGKKVLVIEDSKNIAFVIEKCLTRSGFEVYKADDGVTALSMVYEIVPDLILLDIVVPRLNGYLVCEAIKSSIDVSGIPVVAMSAKTQDTDIRKAFDAGACDYLSKPFTPRELMEKVQKYI